MECEVQPVPDNRRCVHKAHPTGYTRYSLLAILCHLATIRIMSVKYRLTMAASTISRAAFNWSAL